ncbi:MAG: amino acid permease [Planctomycetes bacterium]|nr:amino acid permease [Planctomycetota bacterium]
MPRSRLGFWMTVCLVMGNMIGSGVFLLPTSLAPFGGLSLFGWLISAAGATCLALVFARLARLDPSSGGPYAYTRRAFGELAGFLVAWGYWVSCWVSVAAIAVAGVGYLVPFCPLLATEPALAALLAISMVWLLTLTNIISVRRAGQVQLVTTVLKVLPLVLIGIGGLSYLTPEHFAVHAKTPGEAYSQISTVATLTLWAFLGLECATIPAGAITDPARTIPRATITGTLLTAAFYLLSTIGVIALVPAATLATTTAPFADGASVLFGETAGRCVALCAFISCFGALNGWILVVGQLPLAVARDGLFPPLFAKVSPSGTPVNGLCVAGALATALIAFNYTRGLILLFTFTILLATLAALVPYVFSTLAVFRIPEEKTNPAVANRTARARVVAGLAFAYSMWAISGAGAEAVYWGFLLLIGGLPVFVFVTRARPNV